MWGSEIFHAGPSSPFWPLESLFPCSQQPHWFGCCSEEREGHKIALVISSVSRASQREKQKWFYHSLLQKWFYHSLSLHLQPTWLLIHMSPTTLVVNFPGVRKDCCGEEKAAKICNCQNFILSSTQCDYPACPPPWFYFAAIPNGFGTSPLTPSARISALNIVGDLLRKVGVRGIQSSDVDMLKYGLMCTLNVITWLGILSMNCKLNGFHPVCL